MSAMGGRARSRLIAWILWVRGHAALVLAAAVLIGIGAFEYTAHHLSVNTSTADMLSASLDWRRADAEIDRLFPHQAHTLAIVIDGDSPERAADAQMRLAEALRAQPKLFRGVFAIDTEPFFRREGLLYLDQPQLETLSGALAQAQPFLGSLYRDPSLHGLFGLLAQAAGNAAAQGFDLTPALRQIGTSVAAATDGTNTRLSWQTLMGTGGIGQSNQRFIEVDPVLDSRQLLSAGAAIEAVRGAAASLSLDAAHGVKVRLTGSVALEHEELLSAASGAEIAFAAGLVLVVILLFVALRGWRLVISAMITLIYGLLLTTFFAALAVGHLNLISVAFGVLYVGLGIDYALFLTMQYRERLGSGEDHATALSQAAGDIGGFMAVCAATTSIGFFAFTPTDFTGIAELGLISGGGIFVSLLVSLSVLPALLSLMPPNAAKVRLKPPGTGAIGGLLNLPYRYGRQLWIAAVIAAVGALVLVPKARFDADPLDVRDPASESVSTFRELRKNPDLPTLSLSVLKPDATSAQAEVERLGTLTLVRRTMSLQSFVPNQQPEKLAILDDLNLTLGPGLAGEPPTAPAADDAADTQALSALIAALQAAPADAPDHAVTEELLKQLLRFKSALESTDSAGKTALLARLRDSLLGGLPRLLGDLHESLQAKAVTVDDLPAELSERWRSADGHYRVEIWPRELLDDNIKMAAFVDQVRAAEPAASGPPVDWLESGKAVVRAFQQAFAYALAAITVLLLILLRSVKDMLMVLIPLALAGLLTIGGAVLLDIPFNFANVIALPLILGVGVDYGVYIVQYGRNAGQTNLLTTGPARAVLFGALITVANFGNLALSHHPGTRSMGLLLTVGLAMTLLCALVLLPSLIARRNRLLAGTR